jgi:hypothetical protein
MSVISDQDGLTDDDVHHLYRWLLGRPPEGAGTVRAFRSYYPDTRTGRRAVFESDEFQRYYAGVTGKRPAPVAADVAGALALAFLRRAGGSCLPPAVAAAPALGQGMRTLLQTMGGTSLALVVGGPDASLAELTPLDGDNAAILHVAPHFPAFLPGMGLCGGAHIFRVSLEAPALAAMLRHLPAPIGLLVLQGPPACPALLDDIRPQLAPACLILLGGACEGFDAPALAANVSGWPGVETMPPWQGFSVFHAGGWHLPVAYTPPECPAALPNAEEYPALAIACIARNESRSIAHMLHSALPIASFVAVLDTGSTDDTLDQARAVLAPSGKPFVLEQQMLERFDDMRNNTLALVPDWVEWTLMLDADEALAPEDYAPLLNLLRHAQADAYALPRYNYIGIEMQGPVTPYPDRQIRLLRRTPHRALRYTGAVHETIRDANAARLPLDAAALGLPRAGPHIHHLVRRFRTPAEEDRKQAYYRDLAARFGG